MEYNEKLEEVYNPILQKMIEDYITGRIEYCKRYHLTLNEEELRNFFLNDLLPF